MFVYSHSLQRLPSQTSKIETTLYHLDLVLLLTMRELHHLIICIFKSNVVEMEKSPTKTWSLFTVKVSVPYLKINTQVLCGAVKSSRSLCLLRGTCLSVAQ